jgi:hypothetical protein
MANHKKGDLLNKITTSLKNLDWNLDILDESKHPFYITLNNNSGDKFELIIYMWNLSHGGGAKRPKDEYRIQITGVKNFIKEDNKLTLILGYWDELDVFVGFDVNKHSGILGSSPSLQIRESAIHNALLNGIASYKKENGEIAIAFKPEYIVDYIYDIANWHSMSDLTVEIDDETEDEVLPFRYSITSYGADYTVDSLVKRIKEESIFVPPFQREFVWQFEEASKFIESLILGLPVPGIFLSKESDTGRLLIVDGQQRLLTLYYYYQGFFREKKFKLTNVVGDLLDKSYDELATRDRRKLDDSIIHATVIKQDEPDDNESSIYLIYERLNTGGKKLTPQEVRACIYYGKFNELLSELVHYPEWINMCGILERHKGQELILRFFALYFNYSSYEPTLKNFLNTFMHSNKNLEIHTKETLRNLFIPTIKFIDSCIGKKAFRLSRGLNAAIFDSVMISIAQKISKGDILDSEKFVMEYQNLIKNPQYVDLVESGTSSESSVKGRIAFSINQFDRINK